MSSEHIAHTLDCGCRQKAGATESSEGAVGPRRFPPRILGHLPPGHVLRLHQQLVAHRQKWDLNHDVTHLIRNIIVSILLPACNVAVHLLCDEIGQPRVLPRLHLGYDGRDHEENLPLVSFLSSTYGQYAFLNGVEIQFVDADTEDTTFTLLLSDDP